MVGLLFTPFRAGNLSVRNRVVFTAHLTNSAVDGLPTEQHAAYYAARAAGGAGLIITEEHTVHPSDRPYEKLIRGYDPAVIPGYRRITDAVHAHGTPILAQLNHNGGQASSLYSRLPVWAPSAVPDRLFREVPKAIEPSEIASLVAGYALVASHCMAGGFDGVELQGSHASLIRGFLALATNRRTDRYGGLLANRARFLLEVVAAVRAALGPERVLGVRLPADDRVAGGVTPSDAMEVARLLDATGQVDYLNTSIGVATANQHLITPSMRVQAGYASHLSEALRTVVSLPVIGVGRFTDPSDAEAALAAGHADLIGVVRGQIADPSWADKAASVRPAEIRTCLGCNQECVGRVGFNRWLGCVANPAAGREAVPLPAPHRRELRVHVVGGGPAGLQAAVSAAERGHHVTLFEGSSRLGGQVVEAARAPGRAGFGALAGNLAAEARCVGVHIKLNFVVTAAFLQEERPDAVVLATGARPVRPSWAAAAERVVDVRDVLAGAVDVRGEVLIFDELGFHQATSVASLLAGRGCAVEVATPSMVVGQDLGVTLDLEAWNVEAAAMGIRQTVDIVPISATAGPEGRVTLDLLHHPTGTPLRRSVDWLVISAQQSPVDELWTALADAPFAVHRVGDCLAPRRAQAAVIEGQRAAVAL